MQYAYVIVNVLQREAPESSSSPGVTVFKTEWPDESFAALRPWLPKMAAWPVWMAADIDNPIPQLDVMEEDALQKSDYYREWALPHNIRDYCHTNFVSRPLQSGALGASIYQSRHKFDETDRQFFRMLAPHVRRSILISGMLDEGKLQLQLYRQLLDRIGAGVMIVAQDCRLVYANEIADALLSKGLTLTVRQNKVTAASPPHAKGLKDALDRACTESDAAIGNFGNGIPLTGTDGSVAVCYVLPLGKSERRRELGPGLAAIFVTTHGASIPPALEVLSALSGMTTREARVALMIADGQTPNEAAQALGISVNTLRTHLARIFEKTGVNGQRELARFIGGLSLPVLPEAARKRRSFAALATFHSRDAKKS